MDRLMNAVMLHCRKATYLIEKSNDATLSIVEKLQLNMHLSMCSGCRNYLKQNRFMERLLKRHSYTTLVPKQNSAELEEKIIRNLQNKY